MIFKRRRPACCTFCGKPIRRFQEWSGWGLMGFTRFTAEVAFHNACQRKTPRYQEIKRQIDAGTYQWGARRDHEG